MSTSDILLSAGGSESKLYVDDVFSTYLYTGNGSTQTINNGIDLAGKGGLVWTKSRSSTASHSLTTAPKGLFGGSSDPVLDSSSTASKLTDGVNNLYSVSNTGYGVANGDFPSSRNNLNGTSYVSWTFRRAPKFFDVVTWTGDSVDGRVLTHNFGSAVGMVIVKNTSNSANWNVWHKDAPSNLCLNSAAAQTSTDATWTGTCRSVTDTTMTLYAGGGGISSVNQSCATYVAYLFAHDTSADGIMQCGSFTSAVGVELVTLGWEPQYLLYKRANSSDGSWAIADNMRGVPTGSPSTLLNADTSAAEVAGLNITFSATGFSMDIGSTGDVWIYLAIRRPNKPPTSGSEVYKAIARTGTGVVATVTGVGFAPDLVLSKRRNLVGAASAWIDKLRGPLLALYSSEVGAEASTANSLTAFLNDGFNLGSGAEVN